MLSPRKSLLTAFGLLAAVVATGLVASSGWTQPWDNQIVGALAMRRGDSPHWLISATQALSWTGGGPQRYIIVLLLAGVLWQWWGRPAASAMVAAALLSNLTSSILKDALDRPRPIVVQHLDVVGNASFPSGHATNAAVVYLLMVLLAPEQQRRHWRAPMMLLVMATGISRIMLGVHYPSDVFAGWMLGGAAAMLTATAVRAIQSRT